MVDSPPALRLFGGLIAHEAGPSRSRQARVTEVRLSMCAVAGGVDEAVLAMRLEVGDQLGDRLPDDSPPVDSNAVLGAQDQPGVLQVDQFL
jgi:hypothetical protein